MVVSFFLLIVKNDNAENNHNNDTIPVPVTKSLSLFRIILLNSDIEKKNRINWKYNKSNLMRLNENDAKQSGLNKQ